ncbi:hypothetical protein OA93_14925 [Flavobacterium sp. KMS]|uniref:hypothetical protein n=1 Tax=Flavobacterium sp. KMS TaxID=1566023 RepID=UPI00057F6CF1|nr:hypothetical protein [Flavobacterium sp. KMS]KIA97226.1 hypothetical protein OA93_14925 [Flavobacterium sp. KMS]
MKNILLIICILLFQTDFIFAQNHEKEVISYPKKEMEEQKISGLQIAVIKNNKVLFSKSLDPNDNLAIILFTNLTGIETYTITENISKFYFKD